MSREWDKYLDPRDSKVYSAAGLGTSYGLGKSPALVIVDVQYGFTGDEPNAIEDSIKDYPTSCGETSWKSIASIKKVLNECRTANIPVFYTIIEGEKNSPTENDRVAIKGKIFNHPNLLTGEKGTKVVEEIAPVPGEHVISKKKPSAFFGTPLVSYLTEREIDSVIVVGCTTSGCVRATVVDAFSYNYKVIVPEECVFDRAITSHAINLFDMQQKYADVISTEELLERLNELKEKEIIK